MSKIDIEKVARLARINLKDTEQNKYSKEIESILEYVEKLKSASADNDFRNEQITGLENIVRDDEIKESFPNDVMLLNAPAKKDGYIIVKKVFEDN